MKLATPNAARRLRPDSGQALLICVLIGMVLLLTIPVLVYVNSTSAHHSVASIARDKGSAMAEEGIAYGMKILAALQPNPLVPANPAAFPTDCNGTTNIPSANGGYFRLACASQAANNCPACQPYQIKLKATAYVLDHGHYVPNRAVEAYVSRKTIAASLANGITVPVALRLANPPNAGLSNGLGGFSVWWGAIMLTSNTPVWTIPDSPIQTVGNWKWEGRMDSQQIIRKFSPGPMTGTFPYTRAPNSNVPASDGKEFWAYTSVGFPSAIDQAAYQNLAKLSTCPALPTCTYDAHCDTPLDVALVSNGATSPSPSQDSSLYPAASTLSGNRTGLGWGLGAGGWESPALVSPASPAYLEVDFSGPKTINRINVITLQDAYGGTPPPAVTLGKLFTLAGATEFYVQACNGTCTNSTSPNWADVTGGHIGSVATPNANVWNQIILASPITTSKIQIKVMSAKDNNWARIVGVEAYEPGPGNSCYFPNVGTDTAVFTGTPFTLAQPDGNNAKVVFVNGNAEIDNASMDARNGAIIVTNNLTLGNLTPAQSRAVGRFDLGTTGLHVPITAWQEYVYHPELIGVDNSNHPFVPGQDYPGGTANIAGFVYVGQNLLVHPASTIAFPPPDNNIPWVIYGALTVDGLLSIDPTSGLLLVYTDLTNHKILTSGEFTLEIDSQTEVTAN